MATQLYEYVANFKFVRIYFSIFGVIYTPGFLNKSVWRIPHDFSVKKIFFGISAYGKYVFQSMCHVKYLNML
jgi:hypothetical protein